VEKEKRSTILKRGGGKSQLGAIPFRHGREALGNSLRARGSTTQRRERGGGEERDEIPLKEGEKN